MGICKKYVILANSNDNTFKIPRQLVEINGEKLVARTIRLLRENGIEDITLTASDKRFNDLDAKIYKPNSSDYNYSKSTGYWLNAFPFELLNEPVCFIWGDVYFSEDAIKTIVQTETDKSLFFCTLRNEYKYYIKKHDEPLAFKVIDTDQFKKHIQICKKAKDDGTACREPIIWEVYRSMHGQDINEHEMTTDYVAINDISCDIDSEIDLRNLKEQIELEKQEHERRKNMIKCEVIKDFSLSRIKEVKDLQRKYPTNDDILRVGDTFYCEKDLADYLLGDNARQLVVVKVIEVQPKEEIKEEPKIEPKVIITEELKKQSKKVAKKRK